MPDQCIPLTMEMRMQNDHIKKSTKQMLSRESDGEQQETRDIEVEIQGLNGG